jgi:hypothetical protein
MKFMLTAALAMAAVFVFPIFTEAATTVKMQDGASIRTLQGENSKVSQAMRFLIRVHSDNNFTDIGSNGTFGIELSFTNPHTNELVETFISSLNGYDKIYATGTDDFGVWKDYVVVVNGFTSEYFETKITAKGFIDPEATTGNIGGADLVYAENNLQGEPLSGDGVTRTILQVAENTGYTLTEEGPLLPKEAIEPEMVNDVLVGDLKQDVLTGESVLVSVKGENLESASISLGNKTGNDIVIDNGTSVAGLTDSVTLTASQLNNVLVINSVSAVTNVSVVYLGTSELTVYQPGQGNIEPSPTPDPRVWVDLTNSENYKAGGSVEFTENNGELTVTAKGYNYHGVILKFDLPDGKSLGDYEKLKYDINISGKEPFQAILSKVATSGNPLNNGSVMDRLLGEKAYSDAATGQWINDQEIILEGDNTAVYDPYIGLGMNGMVTFTIRNVRLEPEGIDIPPTVSPSEQPAEPSIVPPSSESPSTEPITSEGPEPSTPVSEPLVLGYTSNTANPEAGLIPFDVSLIGTDIAEASVVSKNSGVEITYLNAQSRAVITFPFNLGETKLSDYSNISITTQHEGGDANNKPIAAYLPPSNYLSMPVDQWVFGDCSNTTTNIKITGSGGQTANYGTTSVTVPINSDAVTQSVSGQIRIGIGLPDAWMNANTKYQILHIELTK